MPKEGACQKALYQVVLCLRSVSSEALLELFLLGKSFPLQVPRQDARPQAVQYSVSVQHLPTLCREVTLRSANTHYPHSRCRQKVRALKQFTPRVSILLTGSFQGKEPGLPGTISPPGRRRKKHLRPHRRASLYHLLTIYFSTAGAARKCAPTSSSRSPVRPPSSPYNSSALTGVSAGKSTRRSTSRPRSTWGPS